MIVVSVQPRIVMVLGHAGYAPHGEDIVCAGVSALVQTLVSSIDSLTDDEPYYIAVPGSFLLETEDLSEKSKFLIDSFFIGICGIASTYPDYVQII